MMAFSRLSGGMASKIRAQGPLARATTLQLFAIITWVPALIFFNSHVAEIAWVSGASMYPYLNTDFDRSLSQDACLNFKWKPTEKLQRGMIVTFWSPTHPDKQVVKRIIALDGDKVFTRAPYPHPIAEVPAGHVWVEGDGGHGGRKSLDSNTYGPIAKNLLTGRITHVLWPWNSFGPVRWWEWKGKTKVIKREQPDVYIF